MPFTTNFKYFNGGQSLMCSLDMSPQIGLESEQAATVYTFESSTFFMNLQVVGIVFSLLKCFRACRAFIQGSRVDRLKMLGKTFLPFQGFTAFRTVQPPRFTPYMSMIPYFQIHINIVSQYSQHWNQFLVKLTNPKSAVRFKDNDWVAKITFSTYTPLKL